MVVNQEKILMDKLDLGYLGFFLGLRMNELVLEQAKKAGYTGFRESHGYVIQHFIEADRSMTELAKRMEITQQAASKTVAELVKLGILEPAPSENKRTKRVRLSKYGWQLVTDTRKARKKIENRLIRKIGTKKYEESKALLIESLYLLGDVERIKARRIRTPR